MMRAAARLGLDLAASGCVWKKSSSSRLFVSSLAAAAEEDVGKKKGMILGSGSVSEANKEKRLYLCFVENSLGGRSHLNHVVRPVRLNSCDDANDYEYLREAAYKRCNHVWDWSSPCRFGSQILFPGGGRGNSAYTHMSWIDTSTAISRKKFKFSTKCKRFSSPKTSPVLLELNDKLYCIDKYDPSHRFEVLDSEDNYGGFKWRPLADPPISRERGTTFASIVEGSNKILAWDSQMIGVCYYDVTKPENGWSRPSSSFSLGNLVPLLGHYRRPPTFIPNYHSSLGDFYLMFTYDLYNEPLLISPYFMSSNCEYFQPIGKIQVPAQLLCSKYSHYTDYELVHLGGQKVCLVLSKSFCGDTLKVKKGGILVLITFEYDVVHPSKSSIPDIQIQTRFLGARHFQYPSRLLPKPANNKTFSVHLTGAFLL